MVKEYQASSFYNDYFNQLRDFKLVKPFEKVKSKENEQFIGEIEAVDCVHPLIIRVEIPLTFPHHKLMFYTKSIYGYPHLIDKGNKESWFCLNTPFAETPEEQLNQELDRLKGWIKTVMREDLPAIITDPNVKQALRKIHAYEWENTDEIDEFHSESNVTFIGDFAYKKDFTKEQIGYFHCIKSRSNNFFILENENLCNDKIPYIIVDDTPNNFGDFISMRDQFNWSEETCDFLLPKFNTGRKEPYISDEFSSPIEIYLNRLEEKEAINKLESAVSELIIPNKLKEEFDSKIESIKKNIHEQHGFPEDEDNRKHLPGESDEAYEWRMYEIDQEIEYNTEVLPYIFNYFILGITINDKIVWKLFYTNHNASKFNKTPLNIGIGEIYISELRSWNLSYNTPNLITEKQYFGRGKFNEEFTNKKITIIGLGAIGSQMAISLARSGVSNLDIWDNDIIEPGNICRSSFTIKDLGNAKIKALEEQLKTINPSISIKTHGYWFQRNINSTVYSEGDFYANINYKSQEDVLSNLKDSDLIIDCTARNELLHYLSYAVKGKDLISVCITNHANNLLLVSNADGNVFELRKFYLSKIEQDTKNFYAEGSGCFSPTFLALNCDIATLVNLAVRELNKTLGKSQPIHTTTWSFDERGIIADKISRYKLKDSEIRLSISSEVIMDTEDLDDVNDLCIGYFLGGYSPDGKSIFITHCISASNANQSLADAFKTSKGIIDYIGDYCYASDEDGNFSENILDLLTDKANNEHINTNNPILAVRTPNGSNFFYLYLNGELIPFEKEY